MNRRHGITGVVLALAMAAPLGGCALDKTDLALRGGRVYVEGTAEPVVEAIAFKEGLLVHVGDNVRLDDLIGPKTRFYDLDRRSVLPLPALASRVASARGRSDEAAPAGEETTMPEAARTVREVLDAHGDSGPEALVEGQTASLVVLEVEPFALTPAALADTPVWLVVIEGEVVYDAKDHR